MSDLVAAMIAAGGPSHTDVNDHRRLHRALVGLGAAGGSAVLPALVARPDPDVGLRVVGVTRALWQLVESGLLTVQERPGGAELVVDESALPSARHVLMRLPEVERRAVYAAADRWASASTSRKKAARALVSPAALRLAREANDRQSAVPSRRQRAVSEKSPA